MKQRLAPTLALVVIGVAGCGFNPAELPIPGTYVDGDKYSVRVEFSSALNLPDKAKVVSEGVEVGIVDSVDLVGDSAVAAVDLQSAVRLPVSTRAELRQATILGEIYVSLQPPDNSSGPYLADGDTIPRAQTAPADNIEDLLRGMSSIVSGGRLAQLQDVVNQFNSAFPATDEDFQRIFVAGQSALRDLTVNTDDIDNILDSAASISTDLAANKERVDQMLQYGPARAEGLSGVVFGVVELIFRLRDLAQPLGDILVPISGDLRDIIAVIAPALVTIGNADTTVPMNIDKTNQLLRDKLIPFLSTTPNIHIDASAQADHLIQILRSIGVVR
ncbi:MCE family protein [Antrihabitans sp. YC3-6]|uniref:MCE family protein n=1 Tax=Antrihabitans stalagmiti TaxID=2799499 RepID=A0A934NPR9_9NOCA|nr:MlaD family protein [Antrihabitans stalagmiti]MBJ8339094.1 MCE family protein [Antrihabitans stalagmiti]